MSSAIQSSSSASARRQSPSVGSGNAEDLIIYCCVCFIPAVSGGIGNTDGSDPPFWLTSCGHIVCGSHCFPGGVPQDASKKTHNCPYCSSSGISLADLGAGKVKSLWNYAITFVPNRSFWRMLLALLSFE